MNVSSREGRGPWRHPGKSIPSRGNNGWRGPGVGAAWGDQRRTWGLKSERTAACLPHPPTLHPQPPEGLLEAKSDLSVTCCGFPVPSGDSLSSGAWDSRPCMACPVPCHLAPTVLLLSPHPPNALTHFTLWASHTPLCLDPSSFPRLISSYWPLTAKLNSSSSRKPSLNSLAESGASPWFQ